jgi:hypothetical protein
MTIHKQRRGLGSPAVGIIAAIVKLRTIRR